jgi:hypothetical protein
MGIKSAELPKPDVILWALFDDDCFSEARGLGNRSCWQQLVVVGDERAGS